MIRFTRTITINSPLEKVFSLLDAPDNWQILITCTHFKTLTDFQQSEKRIGDTFRLTYEVMGNRLEALFTRIEYASPNRMTFKFEDGVNGRMSFDLRPQGAATAVSLDVDFQTADAIMTQSSDTSLVTIMYEKDAGRLLENFQILAETPTA